MASEVIFEYSGYFQSEITWIIEKHIPEHQKQIFGFHFHFHLERIPTVFPKVVIKKKNFFRTREKNLSIR